MYLYCSFESISLSYFSLFFFFQAEDGIRDGHVTGVQTCALPISSFPSVSDATGAPVPRAPVASLTDGNDVACVAFRHRRPPRSRSEERRVGKECRSRWSACQSKKKKEKTCKWPEDK